MTLNNQIGLLKNKFSSEKIKLYYNHLNEKKIRLFKTNNENNSLIDIVGKWRFYIGVKDELTKEELFINVSFIKENFGMLNIYDINQAINLSIKGALEVSAEHYQNFTPIYISKILNAYIKYKNEIVFDVKKELDKTIKPIEPSNTEKLELSKQNLMVLYEKRKDENFYDYGMVTYNFIKHNKLFPLTDELTKRALAYGKKKSIEGVRNTFYDDVINQSNNTHDEKKKKEYYVRQYARNYYVREWLNTYNESEFKKFVNSITFDMVNN